MFVEAHISGAVRKFRLQYNWIPPRCSHCMIFGHKFIDCTERAKTDAEMVPIIGKVVVPNGEVTLGQKEDDFQVPKRRRRRPKKAQTQDNVNTVDSSTPEIIQLTGIAAQETHPTTPMPEMPTGNQAFPVRVHFPVSSPNFETGNQLEGLEKERMREKESFVGTDSSVVFSSTPLATEDFSNPNHATESCYSFSWLDYVGPSTNEEQDSENILCYRDPTGKSHGPFSLVQLNKWSDYLPIDLMIWKSSGTEKEGIHLHRALKRRAAGLKNSNVG